MADIYFDFSATNDGDGTNPAQASVAAGVGAYNTIEGKTQTSGDTWWIRRSGTAESLSAEFEVTVSNLRIIGWPKSGDTEYDNRPAAGTSEGWDSDTANDYAEIINERIYFDAVSRCKLARVEVRRWSSNYSVMPLTTGASSRSLEFDEVYVNSGTDSVNDRYVAKIDGLLHQFRNCIFSGSTDGNEHSVVSIGANRCSFESPTFNFGELAAYNCYGLRVTGSYNHFSDMVVTIANTAYSSHGHGIFVIGHGNKILGLGWTDNQTVLSRKSKIYVGGTNSKVRRVDFNNTGPIVINVDGSGVVLDTKNVRTYQDSYISGRGNLLIADDFQCSDDVTAALKITGEGNAAVLKDLDSWNTADFSITAPSNAAYSLNHEGTAGYWRGESQNGFVESSTAVRTGGADFSLYCERTSSGQSAFPQLGVSGTAEVIWASLASGSNTITFYGAHKLFTNALSKSELIVEVEYSDADGVRQTATSRAAGQLASDSSTWTGDTGLTKFKIALDVTLPSAQVCPVRILGFYTHEANAYLYIDPEPVIT